jgi:hypothetical protein
MTGDYNHGLNFWRYNGDGFNAGPSVVFNDDGSSTFNGPIETLGTIIPTIGGTTVDPPSVKTFLNSGASGFMSKTMPQGMTKTCLIKGTSGGTGLLNVTLIDNNGAYIASYSQPNVNCAKPITFTGTIIN